MYTVSGFIRFLLSELGLIFKWLDFWSWSYFHPCGILIRSVHAFMTATSLMENCTPPRKCLYFSNDFFFFNLIEVSAAILEN